ncbi:restriction endonuclease subunit S [Acidovorax sp.]|uniref:restriction endonuclease subunit S n=1 Tax=Acidovorax sp. TaxID=1872122 RepID=UPI003D02F7DB
MDAQQFLTAFGHIANAPGGVDRLRHLVLHMAVQGRLVQQIPEEGSAVHQLATSRVQMQTWMNEGVIKKEKPAKDVATSEMIFSIPKNWTWCRVVDTGQFINGRGFGQSEWASTGRPIIRIQNLSGGSSEFNRTNVDVDESIIVRSGDLLVSWSATLDAFIWAGEEGLLNQHIFKVTPSPLLNKSFLFWLMKWVIQSLAVSDHAHGLVMRHINRGPFLAHAVPIPTFSEQARIVAKVDELMALCDQLEKLQHDHRRLQKTLRESALQSIARAQSPHDLEKGWQRLQSNFAQLFSEPADVRPFRDLLFDLALRGLLLPDSKLTTDDKTKVEDLGALPNGWRWKTLTDLSEYITSGSRGWKAYSSSTGDSFIRSQDIRQDALVFDNPAFVTLPEQVEGKRTLVHQGDLLLTITGGNVGRCAPVPALDSKAYVSQHVALIRLREPKFSEFIHFWMINTYGGRAFLARYIYGDKPGLNLAQVGSVPVPVPPSGALPKILASLRIQQQLCKELTNQLNAKCEVASRLGVATISWLAGITIKQDKDTSVKAPQTEIIALLRLATLPDVKAQAPLATILARHHGEMAARDLWQRFGGEIDAFYAQLKTEVAHGWIDDPTYVLDQDAPDSPNKYPDGTQVAKVKIQEGA